MASSRVLVADDDRATRESLARAFQLQGYAVTIAVDGDAALAALRNESPDVMLLQVTLPGIDGLMLCRLIRAERNRTPIVLLSAHSETSELVAGLNAGADDLVVKPLKLEELLARVRALLRGAGGAPSRPGNAHDTTPVDWARAHE